jgi:hypothetical protein
MIVAHILGLPIEETASQLVPAAAGLLIGLQLMAMRTRRFLRRRR